MRLFEPEQLEKDDSLRSDSGSTTPRIGVRRDLPTDIGELHLLVEELRDERSSARMREAMWISIIVHLVIFLLFMLSPRIFPKSWFTPAVALAPQLDNHQPTFLELPPDAQKYIPKPKTNILSDKNRLAQSQNPTPYRPTPEEIERMRRQGRPGEQRQQQPAQAQPQQPAPQQTAQAQQPPQPTPPRQEPPQEAKLREPKEETPPNRPNPFSTSKSAGSAIQDAVRAAASGRGVGSSGDYGSGVRPHSGIQSTVDILSDTQGWDYGPYMKRVIDSVRLHWYQLIPEEAGPPFYRTGVVQIEFSILRNGSIGPVVIRSGSGTTSLDHAARGGITASNPFNPLPAEYKGDDLKLRFYFHYLGPKDSVQ